MQRSLASTRIGTSDFEGNPSFNVVTAYEDFETGKHAKETYDFLVQNLGRDCEFTNEMWKFDVLSIPKLCDLAAKDATSADIVLISSHGANQLPRHVKRWIELWAGETGSPIALVALFDCPKEEAWRTEATRSYLAQVAKQAGMEFFAQPDLWPGRQQSAPAASRQPSAELNQKALSTLAGAVQREIAVPRWGINE